jgi:hypothetical protein
MIQQIIVDILFTRVLEVSPLIEKHLGSLNISIYVYSGCEKGMGASE